jgi:hypothetical protein
MRTVSLAFVWASLSVITKNDAPRRSAAGCPEAPVITDEDEYQQLDLDTAAIISAAEERNWLGEMQWTQEHADRFQRQLNEEGCAVLKRCAA